MAYAIVHVSGLSVLGPAAPIFIIWPNRRIPASPNGEKLRSSLSICSKLVAPSMVLSVACTYFSLSGETSGNPKKVLASSAVQSKLIVTFMPLLLKDRRGDVADHLVDRKSTRLKSSH